MQGEIAKQCEPVMSRFSQMESHLSSMQTEQLSVKLHVESRLEAIRSSLLYDDLDVRKDLDRQKTLWHSFMGEMRVRCVRIEGDVEDARRDASGV